ncbi:Putative anti-sigma factor antagonist BtrV [Planctomycetes bacterium Pan216]|uniref:Anti-sigma factor antagonist n=1 Tax=Kolteria novifilia TaxID=2527975 RepID=A0A518AZC5_9BACT|nr:Putative anti-sigma factor antagonist BtrV [Planctomycetes bacterium Pan216]
MSQGRRRRINVENVGDVAVVTFIDKRILDEQNIQVIGEQLFALVKEEGRKKILLNFDAVEYLSSAALGKLITMNKNVKEVKGQLKLCSIRPEIYEVFEITKLNKVFQIYDDQEQALNDFK